MVQVRRGQDAFAVPLMGRGMPWTVLHRDKTATSTLLDLTFMPMAGHFLEESPRLSRLPYGHVHDAYPNRLQNFINHAPTFVVHSRSNSWDLQLACNLTWRLHKTTMPVRPRLWSHSGEFQH